MFTVMFFTAGLFAISLLAVNAAPSPTSPRLGLRLVERDEFVRRDADAPPFVYLPHAPENFLSAPITVTGGLSNCVRLSPPIMRITVFDGGNVRFDRGSGACEDGEGGDDAVFLVQSSGAVQNVVIGADQQEGIHCLGPCNLLNVWFEDVCEDAITIKQSSGQINIVGGGAKKGSDKIVQHNGGGIRTVKIDSYCVQTFGKLYRSCGNCSSQNKRTALISQIIGSSGSTLAGVNSNYGDVAQFDTSRSSLSSVSSICDTYQSNGNGAEPTKLTSNVMNYNCEF
ncbi:pectate lyase-domain-containing protein [Mycena crocata]|nr:pectate lyase-domain-containing protein [Mycena crocata]